MEGSDPHVTYGFTSPQPKWHLDWLSCFAGLITVRDRQTMLLAVDNNRLHLRTYCDVA